MNYLSNTLESFICVSSLLFSDSGLIVSTLEASPNIKVEQKNLVNSLIDTDYVYWGFPGSALFVSCLSFP